MTSMAWQIGQPDNRQMRLDFVHRKKTDIWFNSNIWTVAPEDFLWIRIKEFIQHT